MKLQTARWIFATGTTLSLVLFLGLTADTHRQIRALTHADRLTDQVVAGKKVWHKYNCNDCHTILGFGSYYGPDLTTVYRRRGEARIRTTIMTPEKVTTWRKMPHKRLSEAELADLMAFFRWTGDIDTHDWPPQDHRIRARAAVAMEGAPAGSVAPEAVAGVAPEPPREPGLNRTARRALAAGIGTGAELFREKGCFDCHRIHGVGDDEGPDLTNVGARRSASRIDSVLTNPLWVKPNADMPDPELSPAERAVLVRFLSGLREDREHEGGDSR